MTKRGRPRNFDRSAALQQAMEVFWAQGFDCTSMPDLINAMKINSPSIYSAFGSKEKLFHEAVELYSATEGGRIWDTMTTEPTARLAVKCMLRVSAEEFTRPSKPRGCFIVLGALHAEGGNEAIRRTLHERRAQCMTMLHSRLERAVEEGELPKGPDWREIATFYTVVQQGMSIQARDGASRKSLLAVADYAMAAWEEIISCA